jgi:hypothetical protein
LDGLYSQTQFYSTSAIAAEKRISSSSKNSITTKPHGNLPHLIEVVHVKELKTL